MLRRRGYLHLLLAAEPSSLDVVLLIAGSIGAIVGGLVYPAVGVMFGKLVDDLNSSTCGTVNPATTHSAVQQRVFILACIALGQFAVVYQYMGCWTLFGERLAQRLRKQYVAALLQQEAAYFDTVPAGEVSSRLDHDLHVIQAGVSEKVGICISSFSYFFTAYVVAFILDRTLALYMLSLVPAYLFMGWFGERYSKRFLNQVSGKLTTATSIASECLSNIKIIKSFRLEKRLEQIFASNLISMQRAAWSTAIIASIQLGLLYFISYSANALAIFQGSKQIGSSPSEGKHFTVGQIYTVIFILVDASFVITKVAPYFHLFSVAALASEKLFEIIERKPLIDGTALHKGAIFRIYEAHLMIQNAHFHYPSRPDRPVLNNVSLSIPSGQMTAIVGGSGSGKSTLALLLPRLYDLDTGRIYLDGIDIKDINVNYLRSQYAVVEQNPTLIDCSVLENIAFGLIGSAGLDASILQEPLLDGRLANLSAAAREGKSLEPLLDGDSALQDIVSRVRRAMSLVGGMHFIEAFEHGIATIVGSNGQRLSGGQCQRIAIARAFIRNAPILIFDEATSALDSFAEKHIQQSLEHDFKGTTIIWITHRLSTVKKAAHVVVMEDGQVAEQGNYQELLIRNGRFTELVNMQAIDTVDEKGSVELQSILPHKPAHPTPVPVTIAESVEQVAKEGTADTEYGSETEELPLLPLMDTRLQRNKLHKATLGSVFARVLTLAKPERMWIFFGVVAAVILGLALPANALIFGNMMGHLSPCQPAKVIEESGRLFARLFFGLAVVEFITATARGSAFGFVAEKVLIRTQILLFRSLLYQEIAWHESGGRTPTSLLSYLTTDSTRLSGITGTTLGTSFSIIVSLGVGIVLSHIVAWRIAILLLAAVPILLLSGYLRLSMLSRFHELYHAAFTRSVAIVKNAVETSRTVALFSLETALVNTYSRSLQAPYSEILRCIFFGNFWLALSYSISNLIYALAYWWGSKQVANGNYTQTQFFIVLPALLISAQECGQFFSLAPDISKAGVAAKRILDQLDIGPADQSMSFEQDYGELDESDIGMHAVTAPRKGGISVALIDVHFAYPSRPEDQVLRGISLNVLPNQFAALVGISGSGKSTIISMIERLYSPSSGRVMIDGSDIALYKDYSFRDNLALVPQESILFDTTIRENIALGARSGRSVSDAEIVEVCRQANIHSFISSLPQGYETLCGANGKLMSGGQKQRLSIARALIRRPNLLLLDESTSALDAESETLWQTSLDHIKKTTTVISIAHRLNTIRKADVIFLIDNGICIDKGTHEELCGRNTFYRASVLHQSAR